MKPTGQSWIGLLNQWQGAHRLPEILSLAELARGRGSDRSVEIRGWGGDTVVTVEILWLHKLSNFKGELMPDRKCIQCDSDRVVAGQLKGFGSTPSFPERAGDSGSRASVPLLLLFLLLPHPLLPGLD